MKLTRFFLMAGLALGLTGLHASFAQLPGIPKLPGMGRHNKEDRARKQQQQQQQDGSRVNPPGVPVPPDSPLFDAFRKMQEQKSYRQRIKLSISDPQMEQVMAQMGFAPTDIITAGDTKQVSQHFKMPLHGQPEDFELRAVSRNGRLAKKWLSPASGRIMKEQDAQLAKQLAQAEIQSAKSIARDALAGPYGWISASVSAAAAAASIAEAAKVRKQAHDFWEWSCIDAGGQTAAQARMEPPPLTDLRVLGDQTVEGTAVTAYEFYVRENGRSEGPVQVYIVKDTGLPMRFMMSDPQSRGGMQMDYFGYNDGVDIEVPACLDHK